jgi:hypothetical protein
VTMISRPQLLPLPPSLGRRTLLAEVASHSGQPGAYDPVVEMSVEALGTELMDELPELVERLVELIS